MYGLNPGRQRDDADPSDDSEEQTPYDEYINPNGIEPTVFPLPTTAFQEPPWQPRSGVGAVLHGLVSAPQLNGETVQVMSFVPRAGRWKVQLLLPEHNGRQLRVKPCCLRVHNDVP